MSVDKIPKGTHGGARPNSGPKQGDDYARLAKAKADHEEQKAIMAEMERRTREGELLERDAVTARWVDITARVKAKLLSVPGKVAPQLIGVKSLDEADSIVKTAIHEALRDLAE